mgnify:CR=1 FL=1
MTETTDAAEAAASTVAGAAEEIFGLLRASPAGDKPDDKPSKEPDPLRQRDSAASDKPAAAADDAPAGDEDQPAAEDAADDAAPEGASGDDAKDEPAEAREREGAAIAPPASWSAEQQANWSKLPPAMQRYWLARDSERDQGTQRALQEAAEVKRAAESERQQVAHHLQSLIPALQQQIAGEYADIKTMADVQRLADEDPGRYSRWRAKQDALAYANAEHQRVVERQNAEQKATFENARAEEHGKLAAAFPAEFGPAAAQKTYAEIGAYLLDQGFPTERIRSIYEAGVLKIVRKAMAYDRAQAKVKAKPAPETKPAPKLVKPGAVEERNEGGGRIAALSNKLGKSGRVDDAANLIEAMITPGRRAQR